MPETTPTAPETDAAAVAAAAKHLRARLARPGGVEPFIDPFLLAVAGWWEAALEREAGHLREAEAVYGPDGIGDPIAGDEIHAAITLARAYLRESEEVANGG